MRDFRELVVWQKAKLALDVYRGTSGFPNDERFGLTSQLRRASVSVVANIAEGCGRESEREFGRFLSIAAGSASEVECQLMLSKDLSYLPEEVHSDLNGRVNEVKRMLNSLMQKLTSGDGRRSSSANS